MKTKISLIILAVLTLSACSSYQTSFVDVDKAQAPDVLVVISDFNFYPSTVIVEQGEKITWENRDAQAHTISFDDFESEEIRQGERFSTTADVFIGEYEYHSGSHPFMKGKIIVRE